MPRSKGSQNKVTAEVKVQLQNLIDTVVNSIDVNSMETNQKLHTVTAITTRCTS